MTILAKPSLDSTERNEDEMGRVDSTHLSLTLSFSHDLSDCLTYERVCARERSVISLTFA